MSDDEMVRDLAECYRLSGADPDGNGDRALAPHAVEEVARLRAEHDQAVDVICSVVEALPLAAAQRTGWDDEFLGDEVGRLVDELSEARKVIDAARHARDTPITADPDDYVLAAVVEHLRPLYAAVSRWDTLQAIRHVTTADQEHYEGDGCGHEHIEVSSLANQQLWEVGYGRVKITPPRRLRATVEAETADGGTETIVTVEGDEHTVWAALRAASTPLCHIMTADQEPRP